jgi:hypothetical protein
MTLRARTWFWCHVASTYYYEFTARCSTYCQSLSQRYYVLLYLLPVSITTLLRAALLTASLYHNVTACCSTYCQSLSQRYCVLLYLVA